MAASGRGRKDDVPAGVLQGRASLGQATGKGQSPEAQLQVPIEEALAALDAMQSDSPEVAARRAALQRMKTDSILRQIEQAAFAQQNPELTAALVPTDPVLTATGKLLWPIPHAPVSPSYAPTGFTFEAP